MPFSGTLDIAPLLEAAPRIAGYGAEPWTAEGVEILHLRFEIDERAMTSPLPPALHPTIPPVVIITVATYPDSPAGAFALAQVRVGCRASALPRGFLLQAYASTDKAAAWLASNWGFACSTGDVRLRRFHDRIAGSVLDGGREILRASLIDPEPISGGDVQYVANMNLCRADKDEGRGVLVQVDPDYRCHKAERGRPEAAFDATAWRAEGIELVWPVAASWALADTGMPAIRYVLDPLQPARTGTHKVG